MDRCIFVSMDHIKCPLVTHNSSIFSVSLDQMMSGLVLRMQKIVACGKIVVFLENFKTFRYMMQNKEVKSAVKPFTRIVIFSQKDYDFDEMINNESYAQTTLYNGLFMSFNRQ